MKDRQPRPMTDREIRFMALPNVVQTYIKVGENIEAFKDEGMKASMRDQRYQLYSRMDDPTREALYGYTKFLQDEISRKNGAMGRPVLKHDMNDHI